MYIKGENGSKEFKDFLLRAFKKVEKRNNLERLINKEFLKESHLGDLTREHHNDIK